jgi:sigma-B regulation protein RsbU (phosphoserine phosphatase)
LDDAVCRAIEQYAGAKNPAGLAQDLAESLRERFAAELAEVWTPGGEGGRLERAGACAAAGEPPPPDPLLAERPEALTCTPETGLSRFTGTFREWARANGAARVLLQPMRAGGCAAGLLAIYTRAPLSASLLAAAPLYASMASVALTDAGLFQENSKVINQLQFLVEASQKLNSTLDLAQLLDIILNMACQETEAERGSVFLVDRERREIWTILAHGLEEQEIRLSFGRGVAGHVAENGQTLNVADPYSCPFFDPSFDEKFNYRTRSLLCTPIRNRTGDIVGIMQLLNKKRGTFTGRDEEFLSALSVHMALALENARLHREMLEKQRLERELQLARNIQRSLLPDAPPSVPGYDIAVMNEPCFEVGGDYYDFLMLGPHTLLLVIADVEGKGVSSAMVMSNLQATLRALVMHLHSLEVITLSLNEMILADTHSEKYLSAFLGLVDTRRCGLHYINAGHVPPIVVRADGSVVPLTDGGMVIGLFNAVEYNRGSLRLLPGDIMVCCTDGITEAANLQDDEFGSERLAQVVHENRHLPAEELVNVIGREVSQFARGGPHIDDKVLMVVKVLEGFDPARAAEDSWSV